MRSVVRFGACLALCVGTATSVASATTAPAAASTPSLRPLKVSIAFGKARYAPGDGARLTITLDNTGSARLRRIGAECDHAGDPGELNNRGANWGQLAVTARGVTLAPHSTRTFAISVRIPAAAQRMGQVFVECDFGHRNVYTGYRPQAGASARVPGQTGALAGTVDYYRHGNPQTPAGLKGVRAVLVDPTTCPIRTWRVTTGSHGRFEFTRVPAGEWYRLYLFLPRGWKTRGLHTDPSNALVFGKDTIRESFDVRRGTPPRLTLPTKCG